MSWLITLLLASSVFTNSSGANFGLNQNQNYENANVNKTIVLDETERFEQTYPLNANGKVSVSNINGSITVEAWDKNEVKLEVTKIADSKETLEGVEIKIDSKADYFNAETDYGSWNRWGNKNWKNSRKLEIEFRLSVPRTAVLDEIETVNGSVTVSNFTNYTEISAVNGSVRATNLRGTAKLSTVNGTTNADFERLQPGDKIDLSTVNGSVNLTIPSDANATVKADTVNGSIKNDFGLPVRKGKYVGKDLYGKIGSGETNIKLNSVNGGLSVLRKNDGRNQNPAVNLLPQKNQDDDEDWKDDDDDNDNDSVIKTEKMNRDIARSMKQAQADIQKANVETEKAVADAQKEIEKIQPLIEQETMNAIKDSAKIVAETMTDEMQIKLREEMKLNREKLARLRRTNVSFGSPVINNKTETFDVKPKTKIKIETKKCDIVVHGWDESKVKYEFTDISRERAPKPVEVLTIKGGPVFEIKVSSPDENGYIPDSRRLRLEVFVPKKSDLKILTDGEIRLENVTGEIDLKSAESSINVRDSDGKLVMNAAEGKIRVIGFKGDLDAFASEGDIYLEGIFDKLSANAGEGNIFLALPENANATLLTSGDIHFEDVQSLKESDTQWRIGNGAGKFSFEMPEGVLTVRKSGSAVYTK